MAPGFDVGGSAEGRARASYRRQGCFYAPEGLFGVGFTGISGHGTASVLLGMSFPAGGPRMRRLLALDMHQFGSCP